MADAVPTIAVSHGVMAHSFDEGIAGYIGLHECDMGGFEFFVLKDPCGQSPDPSFRAIHNHYRHMQWPYLQERLEGQRPSLLRGSLLAIEEPESRQL